MAPAVSDVQGNGPQQPHRRFRAASDSARARQWRRERRAKSRITIEGFQERFWGRYMNFRRRRIDGPGEAAKSRQLLVAEGLDDLTVSHL
jgi:hypothetical protein